MGYFCYSSPYTRNCGEGGRARSWLPARCVAFWALTVTAMTGAARAQATAPCPARPALTAGEGCSEPRRPAGPPLSIHGWLCKPDEPSCRNPPIQVANSGDVEVQGFYTLAAGPGEAEVEWNCP